MSGLDRTVFLEATERVSKWRRPLLITHTKPDGDALGSLVAARELLRHCGADPIALMFDPLAPSYAVFERSGPLPVLGSDVTEGDLAAVDGVMLLDTCSKKQIEPIADWLAASSLPKIAVDHHVNRDELVDFYVVDEAAGAACLILYDWAIAMDWPINAVTRDALFIGIGTDTGWFRFSNADTRILTAAADLASKGVRPHELHQQLFQHDTAGRVKLLGAAIHSLELLEHERLAVMTLTDADYAAAGAGPADTENIVNEPMRIATLAVSVILVEQKGGPIRVSLRSKPPLDDGAPDIDVSAVANEFGGGGHRRAAAARIEGSLADVKHKVTQVLARLLNA